MDEFNFFHVGEGGRLAPQAPGAFGLNLASQMVIGYNWLAFLNRVRKKSGLSLLGMNFYHFIQMVKYLQLLIAKVRKLIFHSFILFVSFSYFSLVFRWMTSGTPRSTKVMGDTHFRDTWAVRSAHEVVLGHQTNSFEKSLVICFLCCLPIHSYFFVFHSPVIAVLVVFVWCCYYT